MAKNKLRETLITEVHFTEAVQQRLSERVPKKVLSKIMEFDQNPLFFELQMHSGLAQSGTRNYPGHIIDSMVSQINERASRRPVNAYIDHAKLDFFSAGLPLQDPFASYLVAESHINKADATGRTMNAVAYIFPNHREALLPKLKLGALGDFSLAGFGETRDVNGVEEVLNLELDSIDMIRTGHASMKGTELTSITEQEEPVKFTTEQLLKHLNESNITLEMLQEGSPEFFKKVTEGIANPEAISEEGVKLLLGDNLAKQKALTEAVKAKDEFSAAMKPLFEALGCDADTPVKDVVGRAVSYISASKASFEKDKENTLKLIEHEGFRKAIAEDLKDLQPCSPDELKTLVETKLGEKRKELSKILGKDFEEAELKGTTSLKEHRKGDVEGLFSNLSGGKS